MISTKWIAFAVTLACAALASAAEQPAKPESPVKIDPRTAKLDSLPIDAKDIIAGKPVAAAKVIHSDADGKFAVGVWSCETGTFHWTFGRDEFIYVLEGEATIKYDSGQTISIRGGEVVYFPAGPTTWTVVKPVKKVFTVRER